MLVEHGPGEDRNQRLDDLWPTGLVPVLQDLGLEPKPKGDRIECRCPDCGERRAWVKRTGVPYVYCNRANSCGLQRSVFEMLVERTGSKAAAFEQLRRSSSQPLVLSTPTTAERGRPVLSELAAFCFAGEPIVRDGAEPSDTRTNVHNLLASKGIVPSEISDCGVAKIAPDPARHPYPKWWPAKWWPRYALIAPLYEHDGTFASIQARSVEPNTPQKERQTFPRGCDARGLLFADSAGRALLRGDAEVIAELGGVIVCEGLTDYLRWSSAPVARARRLAVLGYVNGSLPAVVKLRQRWTDRLPVYLGLDADGAGEKYQSEIEAVFEGLDVRRIQIGGGS